MEDIRAYRNQIRSLAHLAAQSPNYPRIVVDFSLSQENDSTLPIAIPIEWVYLTPEEEIANGPACWLWDYLRRSGQGGFFLPLSGGVDSSSVALIVFSMCRMVVDAINAGGGLSGYFLTLAKNMYCWLHNHMFQIFITKSF